MFWIKKYFFRIFIAFYPTATILSRFFTTFQVHGINSLPDPASAPFQITPFYWTVADVFCHVAPPLQQLHLHCYQLWFVISGPRMSVGSLPISMSDHARVQPPVKEGARLPQSGDTWFESQEQQRSQQLYPEDTFILSEKSSSPISSSHESQPGRLEGEQILLFGEAAVLWLYLLQLDIHAASKINCGCIWFIKLLYFSKAFPW